MAHKHRRLPLAEALSRLEREVKQAPAPATPTVTLTPVRDADNRITHVVERRSDGRVFHRVPKRDADQRIVSVTVTEQPAP